VLVARYWRPGPSAEHRVRDEAAVKALRTAFPGRAIVPVLIENVNRGGGGMNCITQQQPASAAFAATCGWAKVKVGVPAASLYPDSSGDGAIASVPRLGPTGNDVHLRALSRAGDRVEVELSGGTDLPGTTGWIERGAIESAGERCPEIAA
jgi:hypothetical protein